MLKICKNKDDVNMRTGPTSARKTEVEAIWERRWLLTPEAYNPLRTAEGRLRIERTWNLIKEHLTHSELACIDLGAGYGVLSKKCANEAAAKVTAVDIAEGALKRIREDQKIHCEKQWVPYTTLPDMSYGMVIATDLIAWLSENEYRLFFSELARLVSREGKIVVSTPLDIYSLNAYQKFLLLAETEMTIEAVQKSYHALSVRFLSMLNRKKWRQRLFKPLIHWIENSDRLLHYLEQMTQFFYADQGISHVVILGKRRPLFTPLSQDKIPIERTPKKTVWE
jgi:2-polyprenyl-3-methyl-5-hydroxy-6-metoxy-1,4-benzoquinol methylase